MIDVGCGYAAYEAERKAAGVSALKDADKSEQQRLNDAASAAEKRADDERKAAMVSNLLVVLCSERDASPVVNAGSIYT